MMDKAKFNGLEVDVFLEATTRRWGHDFHSSVGASLNRRIARRLSIAGLRQVSEMNFLMCRNVTIYFDRNTQSRALKLFFDSLLPPGFFALGGQESMIYCDYNHDYQSFEDKERIYRRLAHV